MNSLAALESLPVTGTAAAQLASGASATGGPGAARPVQVLGNLASITPGAELGTVSHYDVQPVIDIYANVVGTDLGTVTRGMEGIIARHEKNKDLPAGSRSEEHTSELQSLRHL